MRGRALHQPQIPKSRRPSGGHRLAARNIHRRSRNDSKIHSVSLVLLLGGVLAAWRRDSLPLTIYLLAFLPAILNMVTIAGGQQVMRSEADGLGVLIMWSGNALLGVLLWFAYREWARH